MSQANSIQIVVHAFAKFEHAPHSLAARHALQEALETCSNILNDDSELASHAQIRKIVHAWFGRIEKRRLQAFDDRNSTANILKLAIADASLFDDPIFQIDPAKLDRDGIDEVMVILRKPIENWSAKEQRQWDSFKARYLPSLAKNSNVKCR